MLVLAIARYRWRHGIFLKSVDPVHWHIHESQSWWRHQMETISALLALCTGNSPVPVNSPHKGQWRGAVVFSLIYAWINDGVNNREAGDLRRHRAHYDVNVMMLERVKISTKPQRKLNIKNSVTLWLFDCLFRLKTMKTSKLWITDPLLADGFPWQRASSAETIACPDVLTIF